MASQADESPLAARGLIVRIGPGNRNGGTAQPAAEEAWTRTRTAIAEAATTLFLQHGYQDTSTGQIARTASVSKQTIYNHFGGKEALFREIILGVTATAERFAEQLPATFAEITTPRDVSPALLALAHRYLVAVTDPLLLALRRLVLGEAHQFPDLARDYYDRAPALTLRALAAGFADLDQRGVLRVPDADIAADHFASLVVGRALDRGMFTIEASGLSDEQRDRISTHAVDAFLAKYSD
nr:TetR/AcrR family transcriptional regulator [Kibdelosporangium sp. MJ126-NF4]CEL17525.1 Transcriptional regulator, TetR family [Kibdelosporangium sp. MJ126-NF4]